MKIILNSVSDNIVNFDYDSTITYTEDYIKNIMKDKDTLLNSEQLYINDYSKEVIQLLNELKDNINTVNNRGEDIDVKIQLGFRLDFIHN